MQAQPFKRNHLQHALAISRWMALRGATGGQDPATLLMQITLGDRRIVFYPQFTAEGEQGLCFVAQLVPGVTGFVGYYPYAGKAWPAAISKQGFKDMARATGLRTPAWTHDPAEVKGPYLIKAHRSTLGRGQRGPFNQEPGGSPPQPLAEGDFFEQFIFGQLVKAWFWNGALLVVELVPMPSVQGDGQKTIQALVHQQAPAPLAAEQATQRQHLLALQGLEMNTVLAPGAKAVIDYQYMAASNPALYQDYNCRETLRGTALEAQLQQAGQICLESIPAGERAGGVMFSLDAVLDDAGRAWFLEVNCNPLLHPACYPPILDSLFGLPSPTTPAATA